MVENLVTNIINATTMKKWITLTFIVFFIHHIYAQLQIGTYFNKEFNSKLILSDNHYFQFQTYDGIFYHYLRGKWTTNNNQLILSESYYSDKSENLHFMFKLPKFDYTQAKRTSTFIINGNELILNQQEIVPNDAIFLANFVNHLTLIKE